MSTNVLRKTAFALVEKAKYGRVSKVNTVAVPLPYQKHKAAPPLANAASLCTVTGQIAFEISAKVTQIWADRP